MVSVTISGGNLEGTDAMLYSLEVTEVRVVNEPRIKELKSDSLCWGKSSTNSSCARRSQGPSAY
jgi:hypothetical protein